MRISWDVTTPRFDQGVDQGVLYLDEGAVPWNGLVQVEESDTATVVANHYDGRSFRMIENLGNFQARVDALMVPKVFESYAGLDGYLDKQRRKRFGLSYRTGVDNLRQVHLVWNATVLPRVKSYATSSSNPTIDVLQWDLRATPMDIPGANLGAHLVVDLEQVRYPDAWVDLEEILYGTSTTDPRLPSPGEVVELFESYVVFRVTYHDDGTWTAEGPDEWITIHEDGTYEITSPTAFQLDDHTHTLSSY